MKRAAIVLLLLAACSSGSQQTRYLHKNADLGAIGKVAVLPFESLTSEKVPADKVQKIFYVELLSLEVFDVAEPGQVTKVLRASGASIDQLGPAEIQKIGKELGVDGVFTGTVVDFGEARSGPTSAPEVTLQLRLIETHSGTTIWSASQSRSGNGVSTRLFGVGGESLTQVARRIVRAELSTLLK